MPIFGLSRAAMRRTPVGTLWAKAWTLVSASTYLTQGFFLISSAACAGTVMEKPLRACP